ncbi:MAG: hypothetical protein P4L64_12815 [Caulobacteraceae bacterium]|nr:hypothetical protein [Caulobacteraceae bacterium]
MSGAAPLDDLDVPDPSVELAAWQARVHKELTEIGMSIARGMERRELADRAAEIAAVEQGLPLPERDGFDPGLAYSRLARAVRLNLALMTRLGDEQVERERGHAERRTAARAERRAARRRDVVKGVERLVDHEVLEDDDDSEAFYENLYERLDVEQDLAGFDTRPVAEIIASICKDLGVAVETVVGGRDELDGPVGPLHHATRGPPPPRGEELEGVGAEANSSPLGGGGPRSGGGGSPGPSP